MKKLVLVTALYLVALLVFVGCGNDNTVDSRTGVSALTALADSHISYYLSSLQVLALTAEVQSGEWPRMAGLLGKIEESGTPATLWYVLPDGSYYTVTLGLTTQNLSDRAYFPQLMAKENVVGDIVVSKSTGRKSVIIAVPVMSEGEVTGGLGASIFLDDLSQKLRVEMALPDDTLFYALNDVDEVVLHSDTENIIAENPELSQNVTWRTSSLTGWHFALSSK